MRTNAQSRAIARISNASYIGPESGQPPKKLVPLTIPILIRFATFKRPP